MLLLLLLLLLFAMGSGGCDPSTGLYVAVDVRMDCRWTASALFKKKEKKLWSARCFCAGVSLNCQ